LDRAAEIDAGLDFAVLASMMRSLARFADDDIPMDRVDAATVREFFRSWADDVESDAVAPSRSEE
jgi:hypothetical protein